MPAWVKDEAIWEKAKAKAKEEYPDAADDKLYAICTHIYKQMGGTIGKAEHLAKAIPVFFKLP